MEEKLDIRLYVYSNGTLEKVGHRKTGPNPHFFKSIEDCEIRIKNMQDKWKIRGIENPRQYVIVQYFGPYNSRIVKIIE